VASPKTLYYKAFLWHSFSNRPTSDLPLYIFHLLQHCWPTNMRGFPYDLCDCVQKKGTNIKKAKESKYQRPVFIIPFRKVVVPVIKPLCCQKRVFVRARNSYSHRVEQVEAELYVLFGLNSSSRSCLQPGYCGLAQIVLITRLFTKWIYVPGVLQILYRKLLYILNFSLIYNCLYHSTLALKRMADNKFHQHSREHSTTECLCCLCIFIITSSQYYSKEATCCSLNFVTLLLCHIFIISGFCEDEQTWLSLKPPQMAAHTGQSRLLL
jgi:hypothetical protein